MESSKFNLWRACIAFTSIDREVASEEEAWIKTKLDTLKFTPEQLTVIEKDLKNPPQLESLLAAITRPSDRAFLIDQMRQLSRLDGTLSPVERDKIEKLKTIVLSKVNLTSLEQEIALDEKASYHEDEVYKVDNPGSLFETLIRHLQKKANPGDYKFPDKK